MNEEKQNISERNSKPGTASKIAALETPVINPPTTAKLSKALEMKQKKEEEEKKKLEEIKKADEERKQRQKEVFFRQYKNLFSWPLE